MKEFLEDFKTAIMEIATDFCTIIPFAFHKEKKAAKKIASKN